MLGGVSGACNIYAAVAPAWGVTTADPVQVLVHVPSVVSGVAVAVGKVGRTGWAVKLGAGRHPRLSGSVPTDCLEVALVAHGLAEVVVTVGVGRTGGLFAIGCPLTISPVDCACVSDIADALARSISLDLDVGELWAWGSFTCAPFSTSPGKCSGPTHQIALTSSGVVGVGSGGAPNLCAGVCPSLCGAPHGAR